MDRLRERAQQELEAAAAAGRQITELELSEQLAAEFSSECGRSEVRAAVISAMRHKMKLRPRVFPKARGKALRR